MLQLFIVFFIFLNFRVFISLNSWKIIVFYCNIFNVYESDVVAMNDAELVEQILNGNNNAFRFLVSKHQRLVLHVVGRVVQRREDMEDICQEVFIKVFRKLKRFRGESRLSTWIAKIAYNTSISHIRKKIRQNEYSYDEQPALIEAEKDNALNQKVLEKEEAKSLSELTPLLRNCTDRQLAKLNRLVDSHSNAPSSFRVELIFCLYRRTNRDVPWLAKSLLEAGEMSSLDELIPLLARCSNKQLMKLNKLVNTYPCIPHSFHNVLMHQIEAQLAIHKSGTFGHLSTKFFWK